MTSDGRQTKTRRLRELLEKQTLVLPGAFNALTAMQIERAGFQALYVSGAGLSAARGLPDIGLLSLTEVLSDAATIANAVTIPVIVDADTGFGPPLTVMRAVREFEQAGLAGMQIEDQELPKKCGQLSGKRLVPVLDMLAKLTAAVQAKRDRDFMIVARTDARGVEGLDAAIQRAIAYIEAGADALFPEALESGEEFRTFAREIRKAGSTVPLIANMTEFGRTPYLTVGEFESLGYRGVLFPVTALRAAMRAIDKLLAELKMFGSQRDWLDHMMTRQELYNLLRYTDYEEQERRLYEHSDEPTSHS